MWLVVGMLALNGGLRVSAPGSKPAVLFGHMVALPAAITVQRDLAGIELAQF